MCDFLSSVNPGKTFKNVHERDEYDQAYCVIQRLGERADMMSNTAAVVGLMDGFINEHRTTQQSIVRLFCQMLCQWADGEESMLVDARNQIAWDFAKRLRVSVPAFPLV